MSRIQRKKTLSSPWIQPPPSLLIKTTNRVSESQQFDIQCTFGHRVASRVDTLPCSVGVHPTDVPYLRAQLAAFPCADAIVRFKLPSSRGRRVTSYELRQLAAAMGPRLVPDGVGKSTGARRRDRTAEHGAGRETVERPIGRVPGDGTRPVLGYVQASSKTGCRS